MLASPEFTPSQPSLFFSSSPCSNWLWSPYKLLLGLNVSFYWHKCNVTLSLLLSFFHSSYNCLHLIVAPLMCLPLFHSFYNCLHLIVPFFLQLSSSHCSILPPVCYSLFCLHHYKASPFLGHLFSLFQKDALVSEKTSWGHQPLGSTVRELLLKLTVLFGTGRV